MTDQNATWTVLNLDQIVSEPYPEPPTSRTFTVGQARFTAERAGWYEFSRVRPSSHYLVDISAPPNSCSRCGELERGHGERHPYVAPDNVLRLARMKARRQERLNPPRRLTVTPEMLAHITVDFSGFMAATQRLAETLRPAVDRMREFADVLSHNGAGDDEDEDYGEPLTEADANWPDDASRICAHICGGDHECDVRATARLTYALPSGGIRSMPICAACNAAETAAKERVDD